MTSEPAGEDVRCSRVGLHLLQFAAVTLSVGLAVSGCSSPYDDAMSKNCASYDDALAAAEAGSYPDYLADIEAAVAWSDLAAEESGGNKHDRAELNAYVDAVRELWSEASSSGRIPSEPASTTATSICQRH